METSINNIERSIIQVSVGIIRNNKGQLLVAKRPEHWLGAGFWEFPGGKIEPNEDAKAALKRELLEEVGIVVEQCSPLIRLTYDYPERTVILHAWNVESFSGNAAGLEGQEISWRMPASLNQLNMLPANRAIVVATQLPEVYFYTPESFSSNTFHILEETLQKHSIRMLQLRSPCLSLREYSCLANEALAICQESGTRLLLSYPDIEILNLVEADGIHLQSDQVKTLKERPLPKDKWVVASCHNAEEILQAEELGVDFLTLGLVHTVLDEQKALGWDGFEKLVSMANIPIYATGVTEEEVSAVTMRGAQGIMASFS